MNFKTMAILFPLMAGALLAHAESSEVLKLRCANRAHQVIELFSKDTVEASHVLRYWYGNDYLQRELKTGYLFKQISTTQAKVVFTHASEQEVFHIFATRDASGTTAKVQLQFHEFDGVIMEINDMSCTL